MFYEPMMNIFPEHDLLYVSLEECREVAAVAEVALVALVAVLLQHQTSRECLKGFKNNSNHSQDSLVWPNRLRHKLFSKRV